MKNKHSLKNVGRGLALLLCFCLISLPMMGTAANGESDEGGGADSGQEIVVIDIVPEGTATPAPEVVLLSAEQQESHRHRQGRQGSLQKRLHRVL